MGTSKKEEILLCSENVGCRRMTDAESWVVVSGRACLPLACSRGGALGACGRAVYFSCAGLLYSRVLHAADAGRSRAAL